LEAALTANPTLLEELRLLRAMGADGRAAATTALRSARLGRRRPEHPDPPTGAAVPTTDDDGLKFLLRSLDEAIVQRGGGSIFACRPLGTLSPEAEARLEAWAYETPRRHPDTPGVVPRDRPNIPKPGRLVAGLTGKLGGYVSDLEDER
jgi:hypothetical protein